MTQLSAAEILRWWSMCGVDIALDERPNNRFESKFKAQPSKIIPADSIAPAAMKLQPAMPKSFGVSPGQAEQMAAAVASHATTLEELRRGLREFEGCGLKSTALNLVFDGGPPTAHIMLVGDAPSEEDDLTGIPFSGPAGRLLEAMLQSIHLPKSEVRIGNIAPWRPPGGRNPSSQEIAICMPFVKRHIELVQPRILVCLGAVASTTLLGAREGITRMRGRWFAYSSGAISIPAIAMLHPTYLLLHCANKRLAWTDFQSFSDAVDKMKRDL